MVSGCIWLVVTGTMEFCMTFYLLGMSSSQLTKSYFSEGLKSPTSYDVPIYFALPKKVPQACVGSNCVYVGKVIE